MSPAHSSLLVHTGGVLESHAVLVRELQLIKWFRLASVRGETSIWTAAVTRQPVLGPTPWSDSDTRSDSMF